MRTTMLRSFTALFLATAGLSACGVPPEAALPEAAHVEQAASPGQTPIEALPLLDKLPDDGFPPAFDHDRGWSEYRLPDGKRALFLTRAEVEPQAEPGVRAAQATASVSPISDTWFERLQSGAVVDYGRSCELRVNNGNVSLPQRALLRFAIPTTVTCTTITDARLTLTTAQMPTGGNLVVEAQRPSQGWTQGGTGLSTCNSCGVTSGSGAAFVGPSSVGTVASVNVTKPCTRYQWVITSLAKSWCGGGVNNGVLMAGTSGAAVVNFHAMDSAVNRPLLTIVY